MRIGFDVSQTGKAKAGCGYFAFGLVSELASADIANEYVLYPAVGDLFWDQHCGESTFRCDRSNFRQLKPPADFSSSRDFWCNPGPDFEDRLGAPDIFHSNNFFCPRGLVKSRLVYTLYDLSFLEEPAWSTEANRVGCFNGIFQASVFADWIVSISNYTRRHFLSTFPNYPAERVTVAYPGSRFEGSCAARRPERFHNLRPQEFWLSVATLEPRKNQARLLDAYRIFKAHGDCVLPLVMAGGEGWLMHELKASFSGLEPDRDLIVTGYVTDTELQWLLQNCFGLVYPSYFEGFGMPVLEALSLGVPVLCSNTSSMPEAGGCAAVYFDPYDTGSIANAMLRLACGEFSRESLISSALEHAKQFSWSASAARVREVYTQVMRAPRTVAQPRPRVASASAS